MFLYIVFQYSNTQVGSQSTKFLSACDALYMLVLLHWGQEALHCTSRMIAAQLMVLTSFYVTRFIDFISQILVSDLSMEKTAKKAFFFEIGLGPHYMCYFFISC